MRKISTLFFASLFAIASNAQTPACTLYTTGNNGTCPTSFSESQDFNSLTAPDMGGFSGTNWSLQGTQNKFLEYGAAISPGNPSVLLSPTYTYTSSTINVKFDLGGNALSITSIDFGYISQTQPLVQPLCTIANISSNMLPGTICVGLPNPVPNQRIRLVITFNGSANKINFDNFFTNGIAAIGLPVSFTNFQARKAANGMQLTWNVANEEQLNRYEVEKSYDGRSFSSLSSVSATGNNSYTYTDASSLSGTVYYRIRSVDNNGSIKYSNVLKFDNGKASLVLKVFPLPALSNINVQHGISGAGARITLTSENGQVVKTIIPAVSSMQTPVDISSLRAGMYLLRFDDGSGNSETIKFLKQ